MAQLLVTDHTVTALAAGATATFAPGLNDAAGVSLLPNVVMPDRSTPIAVQTVTKSLVTVINNGTAPATAIFRTQQEFSTTDDPAAAGSQWIWQGLGDGGGGSSASGEYKQSVRAATTTALAANTRVGNVLTANAPGALGSIDGVAVVVNDRVLVKNETPKANNGIYLVTSTGGAGAWVLTRSPDADTSAEVTANMWTTVEDGTDPPAGNKHTGYLLATENPITLNVTDLDFIRRWVFDLGGTYQNGAAAVAQVIPLDATRNGIIISDAATPIGAPGTNLFAVSNNAITNVFFEVTNALGTNQSVKALSLQVADGSMTPLTDVSRAVLLVLPGAYNNSGGAISATEHIDVDFDLSHTVTLGGAPTTWRAMRILAPTYAYSPAGVAANTYATAYISGPPIAGAHTTSLVNSYGLWIDAGSVTTQAITVTHAATLAIAGAPTAGGGTITNAYAIWVQAGTLKVDAIGGTQALIEVQAGSAASNAKILLYDSTESTPFQIFNGGTAASLFGITGAAGIIQTAALPILVGSSGVATVTLGTNNIARLQLSTDAEAAGETAVYISANNTGFHKIHVETAAAATGAGHLFLTITP